MVWHTGPIHTLRLFLIRNYLLLLKCYSHSRHFLVKVLSEYRELSAVNASVPQGSECPRVNIVTQCRPTNPIRMYPQLTVVLATDRDPATVSLHSRGNGSLGLACRRCGLCAEEPLTPCRHSRYDRKPECPHLPRKSRQ
jgi:hypothetical protein